MRANNRGPTARITGGIHWIGMEMIPAFITPMLPEPKQAVHQQVSTQPTSPFPFKGRAAARDTSEQKSRDGGTQSRCGICAEDFITARRWKPAWSA
jgi:hypothetical protein